MGCAIGTVRYILFFFNFLLALAGLAILAVGVVTAVSNGQTFDDLTHGLLSTPAIVLSVVGACVFIFAFFGCCGALRESHCMVCTYAVLLLTLFVLQVAVAVVAYTFKGKTDDVVTQNIEKLYQNYSSNEKDKNLVDSLQKQFKCCGSTDNTHPWTTLGISAPSSCYSSSTTQSESTIYSEGCIPTLKNLVRNSLTTIGNVAIAVGIIEVVGIVFSLCLASSIRRAELRGYA